MNRRLTRRLAVVVLAVAAMVIGWRVGITMGWWNATGCSDSREVEKGPDGQVIRIATKHCAQ